MLMLDNWWTSILPIPAFFIALIAVEIRERVIAWRVERAHHTAVAMKQAVREHERRAA